MESPPEIKTEDTEFEQGSGPRIEAYWTIKSPPEIKKEESPDLIVYTGITGVSRSGRIRKKSSKLTDYDIDLPSRHMAERSPKSSQKNIKVKPPMAQSVHLKEKLAMKNVLMKDDQVVQQKYKEAQSVHLKEKLAMKNVLMKDDQVMQQKYKEVSTLCSDRSCGTRFADSAGHLTCGLCPKHVPCALNNRYRPISTTLTNKAMLQIREIRRRIIQGNQHMDCASSDQKFETLDPGSSLERHEIDSKKTQERLKQESSPPIEAYYTMESPPEIKAEYSPDCISSDQNFETLDPISSLETLERDSRETRERLKQGSSPPIETYYIMESPPEIKTEYSPDCTSSNKKFETLNPGSMSLERLERDSREIQERLEQGSSLPMEAYWTMESPPEIKTEDFPDYISSDQNFETLDPISCHETLERDARETQERLKQGSSPPIEAYWTMESPLEIKTEELEFKTEDSSDLAVYTDVIGVSRSGRIRKKSSKLVNFESPDEIDCRYKRWIDRPCKSPEEDIEEDPSMAQSLYLPKKQAKKNVLMKNGQVVEQKKAERKDKRKSRFTSYMLWTREVRPGVIRANQHLDFCAINKLLGELWASVPASKKYNWKRRAKRWKERSDALRKDIEKGGTKPTTQMIRSNSKPKLNQTVVGSTSEVSASTPKVK